MEFSAQVLYDFEAVGEDELSVRAEEVVTIISTMVGEGWWMGRNTEGREGILPEAYVERLERPGGGGLAEGVRRQSAGASSWGDDWDSEEEHKYEDPKDLIPSEPPVYSLPVKSSAPSVSHVGTSERKPTIYRAPPPAVGRREEGKKKFSYVPAVFKQTNQVNEYLCGMTETGATLAKEAVLVNELNKEFFQWEQSGEAYTCKIGDPSKGAKFGGMKGFVLYPITPSFSNIKVHRRYKHFDWLHERLTGKFGSVIAIPPLPERQLTGRFEEDLINKRKTELQSFTDRICRHPVLANSEVWKHFITQTDDKQWTKGKRKAESDNLAGISFLTTIQAPSILRETENAIDVNIYQFQNDIDKMDTAVKSLSSIASEQITKYKTTHKKDYQEIARTFTELGQAAGDSGKCLVSMGETYSDLSSHYEQHAGKDWEPMLNLSHDYKGLVGSWQDILGLYQNMAEKHREISRDGTEKERDCSTARFNTYRIGAQSERNFFQQSLGLDINLASQIFVVEQINFHREMTARLEQLYARCWAPESGASQENSDENLPPPPPPVDPLNAWD